MLDTSNQLRGSYESYQKREIRIACSEIPEERRQSLRDEILTRANTLGAANPEALKAALASLN